MNMSQIYSKSASPLSAPKTPKNVADMEFYDNLNELLKSCDAQPIGFTFRFLKQVKTGKGNFNLVKIHSEIEHYFVNVYDYELNYFARTFDSRYLLALTHFAQTYDFCIPQLKSKLRFLYMKSNCRDKVQEPISLDVTQILDVISSVFDDDYREQIFDLFGLFKMSDSMESFKITLDSYKPTFDKFISILESFSIGLQKAQAETTFAKLIRCFTTSLKTQFVTIIMEVYDMFHAEHITMTSFVKFLSLLGLSQFLTETISMELVEFISGFLPFVQSVSPEYQEQIGVSDAISFIESFIGGKAASDDLWRFSRNVQAIEKLFNLITAYLEKLGLIPDQATKEFSYLRQEILDIQAELDEVDLRLIENPKNYYNSTIKSRIDKLHSEVSKIYNKLTHQAKHITGERVYQIAFSVKMRVDRLRGEFIRIENGLKTRPVPVGINLLGEGGIGKSQFSTQLVTGLARYIDNNKEHLSQKLSEFVSIDPSENLLDFLDDIKSWSCWSQNTNDDYMTGYQGQEVHLVDDAFQDKEEKDHLSYFNLISNTPFPTNQAALEDKGKMYNSRIVICSSNKFPTASKTVNDVKALARRFRIVKMEKISEVPSGSFDDKFSHIKFSLCSGLEYVAPKATSPDLKDITLDEIYFNIIVQLVLNQKTFLDSVYNQTNFKENATDDYEIFELSDDEYSDKINSFTHYCKLTDLPHSQGVNIDKGLYSMKNAFNPKFYRVFIRTKTAGTPIIELFNHLDNEQEIITGFASQDTEVLYNDDGTPRKNCNLAWRLWSEGYNTPFAIVGENDRCIYSVTYEETGPKQQVFVTKPVTDENGTETNIPKYSQRTWSEYVKTKSRSYFASIKNFLSKFSCCFDLLKAALMKYGTFLAWIHYYIYQAVLWLIDAPIFAEFCSQLGVNLINSVLTGYAAVFAILSYYTIKVAIGRFIWPNYYACGSKCLNKDTIPANGFGTYLAQTYCKQNCSNYLLFKSHTKHCKNLSYFKYVWSRYLCGCNSSTCTSKDCAHNNKIDEGSLLAARQFIMDNPSLFKLDVVKSKCKALGFKISRPALLKIYSQIFKFRIDVSLDGLINLSPFVVTFTEEGIQTVKRSLLKSRKKAFSTVCHDLDRETGLCKNCFSDRSQIRESLHEEHPCNYYCNEDSSESKNVQRKKLVVEDSSESKNVARKRLVVEDSSESKNVSRKNFKIEINQGLIDQSQPSIYFGEIPYDLDEVVWNAQANSDIFEDEDELTEIEVDKYNNASRKMQEEYCRRRPRPQKEKDVFVDEVSEDPAARPIMEKFIQNNIRIYSSDDRYLLSGIPFKDNIFIAPYHLKAHLTAFSYGTHGTDLNKKVFHIQYINGKAEWDVALYKAESLSTAPVQFPDFSKHLMLKEEIVDRLRQSNSAFQFYPTSSPRTNLFSPIDVRMGTSVEYINDNKEYHDLITVKSIVGHGAPTRAGDCGGVIILNNTKVARKLVGMHVLGSVVDSRAALICLERIQELLEPKIEVPEEEVKPQSFKEEIKLEEVEIHDQTFVSTSERLIPRINDIEYKDHPVGDFVNLGVTEFSNPIPRKSMLQPSVFHGTFPVEVAPAVFRIEDVIDPSKLVVDSTGQPNLLVSQTSKWGKVFEPVDGLSTDLSEMEEELTQYYADVFEGTDLSPLSLFDAINGKDKLERINVKSSPGLPFVRKYDSKLSMLEPEKLSNGEVVYHPNRELVEAVETRIEAARDNLRVWSVWKDCLKDEVRPLAKVAQGKTRAFTCSPIDYGIAIRMLMGRFKHQFKVLNTKLFHSVGINPMSYEWSDLYDRMSKISNVGLDCDYSTYDGNLRRDFMEVAIRVIINTVYKYSSSLTRESDSTALKVLLSEIICTIQQSGAALYMSKHGNPSGSPLTTEINCMVNMMYHWYCYRKITGYRSLNKFSEDCFFTCFGDDALLVFKPTTGITFHKVREIMATLGQDYTNAAKDTDGSEEALVPIDKLSFLKRGFNKYSNLIVFAPIEPASIEKEFTYCKYEEHAAPIIADVLENAVLEAAMISEPYFNHFVDKIFPIWKSYQMRRGVNAIRWHYKDSIKILIEKWTK